MEFYERLEQQETLTDNWFGFGKQLTERGIEIGLSATQVYQLNLHGGLAMHRRAGRYTGSYDLELAADLETLLGIPGASIYAHAEGSWSDGLSASSVGDLFGVNGDAAGDRAVDLTELYWEQAILGDRLILRAGKMDLTGGFECKGCAVAFDTSMYAGDETSQFLSAALVNNPTIPFPEQGMGVAVYASPVEWMYVAGAVADAEAVAAETGFNTAFHSPNHVFTIAEAGVVPEFGSPNGDLVGAYRVGVWHDGRPKTRWNDPASEKRDDVGFYVTIDQQVFRENADPADRQGAAVFARYGYAHDDVNEIECFWSVGGQYRGPLPGRDEDVLGVGFAQGLLVEAAGFDRSHESVLEVYYNTQVTPWMSIAPSLQYIWNPGGVSGVSDAVVVGLRCQIAF
jgi:porin